LIIFLTLKVEKVSMQWFRDSQASFCPLVKFSRDEGGIGEGGVRDDAPASCLGEQMDEVAALFYKMDNVYWGGGSKFKEKTVSSSLAM
jgi:hypothetical protein